METIKVGSLAELPRAAEKILSSREGRTVVAFYGPMGAGKTTLIREIASQLGVCDTVTSPTFALINQYRTADDDIVNHFDFYRIDKREEAFDLGYEEYFYSGDLCLVEWPEKIETLLPENVMVVRIIPTGHETREITIDPQV